jgi:hypothetical protein
MKHALVALTLCLFAALPAAAQPGAGVGAGRADRIPPNLIQTPRRQQAVRVDDANAHEARQHLQEMLQQYPPTLGTVLAIDPTLLDSDAYLQPYPQLATFIAQHPDIAHNPGFYFESQLQQFSRRNGDWNDPRLAMIRAVDSSLAGLGGLIAGLCVLGTFAWLIRSVIEHRKWLRMSKTHIETHAKLMDRLTTNEDLIRYMESPAGRKFLEAAPIPLDGGPRMLNAPFGRILWSVQAGVVVAFLGAGLIYGSRRLAGSDIFSGGELPIFLVGCAAVAVGAGFFISAFAAYGLSHRLGLFPAGGSSHLDSGSGHSS